MTAIRHPIVIGSMPKFMAMCQLLRQSAADTPVATKRLDDRRANASRGYHFTGKVK